MQLHLDKNYDKAYKITNEVLKEIEKYVEAHLDDTKDVEMIVIGEFRNINEIPFTISLFLTNGQLCYCKTPLEKDMSNWEDVCLKLCTGYNMVAEEINKTEAYPCVIDGRNTQFSKVYGTYTFSDEECQKLANGETIFFVADTKENENGESYKYVAVGKVEQADYEDEEWGKLVGFRRHGFVRDMSYQGLRAYYKRGQLFKKEEIADLLDGKTIEHIYVADDGTQRKVELKYNHDTDKLEKVVNLYKNFVKYCANMYGGRINDDGKLETFSEKDLNRFIENFKKKNDCEISYHVEIKGGESYFIVDSVELK